MKKIAVIIGHNENSPGAINKSNNVSEFEFNEPLAFAVARKLEDDGYSALVVYRDTSYSELPAKVNSTGADIAVSLHCNAFNSGANGTETLYYHTSKNGKRLASLIQDEIVDCLMLPDRGTKARKGAHKGSAGDRGGHLLKNTVMPCVIVEPFFIDCDSSLLLAITKIDELSEAYSCGIQAYFDKQE